MKASVLAIGTELTNGQILNKNATAISQKLNAFGLQTDLHLTVPDNHKLMLESMRYLESQSDLIFITGGLGPTSDDFTRDVVAKWVGKPLQFNEESWQQIVNRLSARGMQVREIQRQQCFFPEGCEILKNKEGTANAFYLRHKFTERELHVFILPGPPREIENIWSDYIHTWLVENTKGLNKKVTKAWDTLGVGESDVALMVEEVLAQFSKSRQLEIGYRVHLPYVEVKISYDENQSAVFHEILLQLDTKLKHITITRDFQDVVNTLETKISTLDFTFYDFLTQGYLHTRLSPLLKTLKNWSYKQGYDSEMTPDFFENEDNFIALLPQDEQTCLVIGACNTIRFQKSIEAPMKSTLMSERRKQYFAEMALVTLSKVSR